MCIFIQDSIVGLFTVHRNITRCLYAYSDLTVIITALHVSLIIAEVFRNSLMLLTNRLVEVRTLRDPEIFILDTGQLGNDFVMM